MDPPEGLPSKPGVKKPRSRRVARWISLGFLLLLILTPLGLIVAAYLTLHAAEAEADRLDPGWRFEENEARRRAETIPPAEDAALRVGGVIKRLPAGWAEPCSCSDLSNALLKLAPNERLDASMAAALRTEVDRLAPAIEEARPLNDLSRGRLAFDTRTPVFDNPLSETMKTRKVASLLELAAIHRAQCDDLDGALCDGRAIIGVSDAIGDEPTIISMLVRLAEVHVAIKVTERILAQGEASDEALVRMQERIAAEGRVPFGLIGLRGERASEYQYLGLYADGTQPVYSPGDPQGPPPGGKIFNRSLTPFWRYNQGLMLRFMNRAVEIAKLPIAEQGPRWKHWKTLTKPPDNRFRVLPGIPTYLMIPGVSAFQMADSRIHGLIGVTQVMIAMERFRLARHHWPETLQEIPRSILPELPIDPFCGEPVRIARVSDGWSVYCVGPDGQDDGGKLDPTFREDRKGFDWGYRLWDVGHRRQPRSPKTVTEPRS
jgi:hypothetical protein